MNRQTRFQFSLKQMLWGAFTGAVIAAVAAQFVHRMNPAQMRWFAAFLADTAAGFVAARIVRAQRGGKIHTAAGQFFSNWIALEPPIFVRLGLVFYLAVIVSSVALSAIGTANSYQVAHYLNSFGPFHVVVASSFLVPFMYGGLYGLCFYGGGKMALCENGIVLDNRLFLPWADIKSYCWNDSQTREKMRFSFRPSARCKLPRLYRRNFIRVPATIRDQFESLLTANSVACRTAE